MPKYTVILKRILVLFFSLIVIAFISIYWFTKNTLPDYSGNYQVEGITNEIKIIRDQYAVPNIFATNQNDLAFGMGYAMAEDRLWQMDLFVRVAKGRLSEIFGKRTIKADRFSKILGFEFESNQLVKELPLDEINYLKSFIGGINHYITQHPNEVPIEFHVLDYQPTLFTIQDIMALSYYKSYVSNHNWKYELLRATAIEELGESVGRELIPAITFNGPYMAEPSVEKKDEGEAQVIPFKTQKKTISDPLAITNMLDELLAMDSQVKALSGFESNEIHSNYFAVSPSRSESGHAIFANDYHMPFLLPSLWYEVRLVNTGDNPFDAVGITMPGSPTILAGHNQNIAWGATTTGADTQDIYYEKLNPKNKDEYLFKGKYYPLETRQEVIFYKHDGGLKQEKLQVRRTRHGPIINDIVQDKGLALKTLEQPIALQTVTRPADGQIRFAMDIYKAKDWKEFKDAIAEVRTPIWNWGYADRQGNIGYKNNGKVPIRNNSKGLEPKNGWDGEHEWLGYLDFDELPEVYNPKEGFIVSANNEITSDENLPKILQTIFQLPYRAIRIEELIRSKGKLTQKDIQKIQLDDQSKFGLKLRDEVLSAFEAQRPHNARINEAIDYLKGWNGSTNINSVANSIIQEFFIQLLHRTFANKISEKLFNHMIGSGNLNYVASVLLTKLNDNHLNLTNSNSWFDDPTTKIKESKQETIIASLNDALNSLSEAVGDDMKTWRWGELHQTHFQHQMGKVAPFKWLWNIAPQEYPGDISTVNPGTFHKFDTKPYRADHGASMRHIVEFGNLQSSNLLITTGQSGRWLSDYYDDQAKIWHDGNYIEVSVNLGTSALVTRFIPKEWDVDN